ncbi:uncharacterized protein MYCGRDRAFT_97930 [Zymoseptoria tritici IPO323]|uniref:Uncharacterized protein n=1 Tax=Zymoseptoria tritici (strain CBS 115943 / IPO323) TaxID=336722 RepID=F9XRT7_ZYMTI|nr:uncharacterized protein MYCGRDRAFT_97930 [Zymoseptoria tritici IPO323]EGP81972.1 hypothetical protein MYCGRDRAFT_97930 [Zymoseptoria tritici IPO323]
MDDPTSKDTYACFEKVMEMLRGPNLDTEELDVNLAILNISAVKNSLWQLYIIPFDQLGPPSKREDDGRPTAQITVLPGGHGQSMANTAVVKRRRAGPRGSRAASRSSRKDKGPDPTRRPPTRSSQRLAAQRDAPKRRQLRLFIIHVRGEARQHDVEFKRTLIGEFAAGRSQRSSGIVVIFRGIARGPVRRILHGRLQKHLQQPEHEAKQCRRCESISGSVQRLPTKQSPDTDLRFVSPSGRRARQSSNDQSAMEDRRFRDGVKEIENEPEERLEEECILFQAPGDCPELEQQLSQRLLRTFSWKVP